MMLAVTSAILLTQAFWCQGETLLPSQRDMEYESAGLKRDCWISVGILVTNTSVLHSNAKLDRILDDVTLHKIKLELDDIRKRICPTPATGIHIFVKCNPNLKIPSATEITLNRSELCNTKTPEHISYNQTPVLSIIRKKRETSWTEHITKKHTMPNGPGLSWAEYIKKKETMSSGPSHAEDDWISRYVTQSHIAPPKAPVISERFDALQNKPTSWLSYINGPQPAKPIQGECGKVIATNLHPLLFHATRTLPGDWPWQIALYKHKHFTCGGTLVSRQHVVTAAHCVTHKNSQNTLSRGVLSVYLGIHNLRNSTQDVQNQNVEMITVHPQYSASSLTHDIAVLKLAGPVQVTEFVRPACLWPEHQVDLLYVIGSIGTVVGWGFNENFLATEELGLVKMPIVSQEKCLMVNGVFDRSTSYCAGFRDDTTACYGDSGGGMVLKIGDTWHLRGVVSAGINNCDPSRYVLFTDVAKFLPWLKEILH